MKYGSDDEYSAYSPQVRTRVFNINETNEDAPLFDSNSDNLDAVEVYETPESQKTSLWRTTFNITKCFIGAASFELPWAIKKAGILGGILGILALSFMSFYTLLLLVRCGHLVPRNPRPTYPEIGSEAFGRIGSFFAWLGIVAMTIGVCGSYLVFMGTSLHVLLVVYSSVFTTWFCTLMVLPFIVVLSWLRSYKFLAPTSVLGILALLFSVGVTLYDGAKNETIKGVEYYPLFEVSTFPLFLGNAAFLYLIHSVILPTEQSMKNKKEYPIALTISMVFVTILNLGFAIIAYLWWGKHTKGNIIDNLTHGVVATLVRIFLSLDLFFTTALFLFPITEVIEFTFLDFRKFGNFKIEMLRNVIRAIMVGLITAVALAIPFFALLTGLSGVFGNNLLGFILPCIFYIRLQWKRGYWRTISFYKIVRFNLNEWTKVGELFLNVFIIVFGIVMGILGWIAFIKAIIKKYSG